MKSFFARSFLIIISGAVLSFGFLVINFYASAYTKDNCQYHPNGPDASMGTCTRGAPTDNFGDSCNSGTNCGSPGFCSFGQEDLDEDGVGDACDANTCGNSIKEEKEYCDTGDYDVPTPAESNKDRQYECASDCLLTVGGYCGNTGVESAEDCDGEGGLGTSITDQYECSIDCAWSGGWCGDAQVETSYGEACESSGCGKSETDQYECNNCKWAGGYCGNGQVENEEKCDNGSSGSGAKDVEITIIFDTSKSMNEQAQALCDNMVEIETVLDVQGINLKYEILGINEDAGDLTARDKQGDGQPDFYCLENSVEELYDDNNKDCNTSGGYIKKGSRNDEYECGEDWAGAMQAVAKNKSWESGYARLVVVLSDESPENGNKWYDYVCQGVTLCNKPGESYHNTPCNPGDSSACGGVSARCQDWASCTDYQTSTNTIVSDDTICPGQCIQVGSDDNDTQSLNKAIQAIESQKIMPFMIFDQSGYLEAIGPNYDVYKDSTASYQDGDSFYNYVKAVVEGASGKVVKPSSLRDIPQIIVDMVREATCDYDSDGQMDCGLTTPCGENIEVRDCYQALDVNTPFLGIGNESDDPGISSYFGKNNLYASKYRVVGKGFQTSNNGGSSWSECVLKECSQANFKVGGEDIKYYFNDMLFLDNVYQNLCVNACGALLDTLETTTTHWFKDAAGNFISYAGAGYTIQTIDRESSVSSPVVISSGVTDANSQVTQNLKIEDVVYKDDNKCAVWMNTTSIDSAFPWSFGNIGVAGYFLGEIDFCSTYPYVSGCL